MGKGRALLLLLRHRPRGTATRDPLRARYPQSQGNRYHGRATSSVEQDTLTGGAANVTVSAAAGRCILLHPRQIRQTNELTGSGATPERLSQQGRVSMRFAGQLEVILH